MVAYSAEVFWLRVCERLLIQTLLGPWGPGVSGGRADVPQLFRPVGLSRETAPYAYDGDGHGLGVLDHGGCRSYNIIWYNSFFSFVLGLIRLSVIDIEFFFKEVDRKQPYFLGCIPGISSI